MRIFLIILTAIILNTGCENPNKIYLGTHHFQVPIATLYKDTSEVFYDFGMKSYPSVTYLELYPGEFEITENGNELKANFKFKYPENASLFNSKTKIGEKTFGITRCSILNDTLFFSIQPANAIAGNTAFSGFSYKDENGLVFGVSAEIFNIKPSSCVNSVLHRISPDMLFFRTYQLTDPKKFYDCQIDSLKNISASTEKESIRKNNERTIRFLESKKQ